MAEGSEIFDTYQKEYDSLHESLLRKIEGVGVATGEQKKLLYNQAERELEEAEEIISQMEVELSSLAQAPRMQLAPRVRSHKEDIKSLRQSLQKHASDRDQLLGRPGSHVVDFEVSSMDQRGRLLNGTERLQDGSRRLEGVQRLALETEAIGVQTLDDLNRQREQIRRTQNTLSTADTWVAKSQGVLRGMQRRLVQNKILSYGIITLLIIIILAIIYLKWF
ncbi:hypothetical protein BC832DRAFT_462919 [Gaertneriomyces semiglobifer]|nr:hypothetical protein BC832DRAFT_462919 [Gaertneriomyces semiglobifer]